MGTENESAIFAAIEFEADEVQFDDLVFLQDEHEHINSPDHLDETIMNVVWEQFMNQVAAIAGEDFIKENRGLTLDLRSEVHI